MSRNDDDGPVYYREIQKNAYLKRIPNESSGSKLRPLGHKKPPLKPMWTLFCVHNGRTPYLEQYPDPESPATVSHKPLWRACLRTARHVTASVQPHVGREHDFLIHTDTGLYRMLAPDWDSMQDWVTTLRSKLHELKILSKGENVYCAAPAPPPPRAGTRDPTSPLPPTPPVPPDRVPGIELITPATRQIQNAEPTTAETPEPPTEAGNPEPSQNHVETNAETTIENDMNLESNIDISDWDSTLNLSSVPSTSHEKKNEPKKSVAKICGQNICVDDSIFKRTASNGTDSDEEFFNEIDRIHDSIENVDSMNLDGEMVNFEEKTNSYKDLAESGFKQRMVVSSEVDKAGATHSIANEEAPRTSEYQGTNITVIQVSNKAPPHTAIPVMGPETDVFNFEFKQQLSVNPENNEKVGEKYVNIVNTEINVQNNTENGYGTVFSTPQTESEYGHLSLTTTVSLTGALTSDVNMTEGIYERLCMASTSSGIPSPLPVRKLKLTEKSRKSSLPNLDLDKPSSSDSNATYEYLYPGSNPNVATPSNNNTSKNTTVNLNTSNTNLERRNHQNVIKINNQRVEVNSNNTVSTNTNTETNNSSTPSISNTNITNTRPNIPITRPNVNRNLQNGRNLHSALVNSISVGVSADIDPNSRVIRSNVERSHSQNAYDSPRLRDRLISRENSSPKGDGKNDKPTQPVQAKPIWKRGLTEFSLLSRLRGIGQTKADTAARNDNNDRTMSSPVKVVHRSRPENRVDSTRRRSSSLSNGQTQPAQHAPPLLSLRAREAASLLAEQARGAAVAARVPHIHAPLLCEHEKQLWVAWWGRCGAWHGGRAGDRVAALRGTRPRDLPHAKQLIKMHQPGHKLDILFHRVPQGKIYILNKEREDESIGIKLEADCTIAAVQEGSPAARAGVPPPGSWAVTEINNRPINLIKGGQEDMSRLSSCGKEVSVLIQPASLVKKLRATMKSNKNLLGLR